MNLTVKIFSVLIVAILIAGCGKLVSNLPSAPLVTTHKEGIKDPGSPNFHGSLVKMNQWDMRPCQQCHASDYSGGIADASCLKCHTNQNGPEACNTCHGDFGDLSRIAPPRDTDKNTETSETGVGAHVKHLYENQLGSQIPCTTCHLVPQEVYVPRHVDSDLPAEVMFGELAIRNKGVNSTYDYPSATCSEVYCHGNWEFLADSSNNPTYYDSTGVIKGNSKSVIWNIVDGSQAPCGSCHNLPPTGHNPSNLPISSCGGCHNNIVDTDGNIVDSTQHINGLRSVFGTEY